MRILNISHLRQSAAICAWNSVKPEDMRDAQDEIKLVLKAVEDQPGFGEVKVHVLL